ncbi:MAG: pilus assembly protein [Anaerolineae bacterium]|nr:pilus assembly protein [Anaerolineae bacterium]
MKISSKFNKKEDGQGLVEFALVIPLLLFVLLGVVEIGRIMFVYAATTTSAREGARYGIAIEENAEKVPHYLDCDGIRKAAQGIGKFAGVTDADVSIRYEIFAHPVYKAYDQNTWPDCGDVGLGPEDIDFGDRVEVTVIGEYNPIFVFLNFDGFKITSTSRRIIVKGIKVEER